MNMGFLSGLTELLFPPKCMFCRRVLPGGRTGYCQTCEETLIRPLPNVEGASFRLCCVALPYEGNVRDALIRFKFGDKPGYASELGKILAGTVQRELDWL